MKKWIYFLVLCLSINIAQADLLLEPYAGTIVNTKIENGEGEKNAMSGTALGARVGWQRLGLMLGVDYLTSNPKVEDDKADYSLNSIGFFVGYDFPVLLRVWAGMVFSGSLTISASGHEFKYAEQSGTKFGIGYKILPFVSLNFELSNLDFKAAEIDGKDVSDNFKDSTGNAIYTLGVSFPINI